MSAKFRGEGAPYEKMADRKAEPSQNLVTERVQKPMTMDGSGSDSPALLPVGHEAADELDCENEAVEISAEANGVSLEELAAQLEQDPGECRRACEGLESVDVETRVSIIEGLAGISAGAGIMSLLQLLAASESAETREAALAVQKILDGREDSVEKKEKEEGKRKKEAGGKTGLRASSVEAEPWDDPGAGHAQGVLDVASIRPGRSCWSGTKLDPAW